MARPFKHPKTGIFWFRKAAPEDLRGLVGKREEKRSLQTRDPQEARRRHAEVLSEVEARWAALRAGPQTLSEREAHELALVCYEQWLENYRDNPSQQVFWPIEVGESVFAPPPPFDPRNPRAGLWEEITPALLKRWELEKWCSDNATKLLASKGLVVDEASCLKLAKAIAAAVHRASETLVRFARGETARAARSDLGEAEHKAQEQPAARKPIRFGQLLDGWAAEKRPVAKTVYEWRRVIGQLAAYVGHDDALRLTSDNLLAWKSSMIEAGLASKTIRDAKLAPVRTILRWAVENRRLPANPAERIGMGVKVRAGEGKRSFTDEEARVILRAALKQEDPVLRWVPWVCAYSGARLSEVCQLRAEDVQEIEGVWSIRFDPEAGPLKTLSSERAVPIHPALIDVGFVAFARGVGSGPLFADLPPDKFGRRGGNGTKVLGR